MHTVEVFKNGSYISYTFANKELALTSIQETWGGVGNLVLREVGEATHVLLGGVLVAFMCPYEVHTILNEFVNFNR